MNRVVSILISIAIVLLGVVGLWFFGEAPEVKNKKPSEEEQAVLVEVDHVSEWTDSLQVVVDGEAATYRIVSLSSEVAGRIVSKPESSRGGMFVQKDQTLFKIDPTNYQLQVERLDVQLAQNKEEQTATEVEIDNTKELIALAKQNLDLQEKHLKRVKGLLDQGSVNDMEVEEATKMKLTSRNSWQTLQNQQRSLEQQLKTQAAGARIIQSELDRGKEDLARCVIKAPLTGRLVDDVVEEGSYVTAGDELTHVSDSSRMEIRTKLRAEQLAWIWLQHQIKPHPSSAAQEPAASLDPLNLPPVACEVAYEFEGVETIWDGYISRLEGTGIDRDTRTFPCRVLVEDPKKTRVRQRDAGKASVRPPGLLSGMYVTVRITVQSPTKLLRVPLESVRPGGQIWVKTADNTVEIQSVEPAFTVDNHVLLRANQCELDVGDEVIVSPLTSVRNGLLVVTAEPEAGMNAESAVEPQGNEGEQPPSPPKEDSK